MKSMNMRLSGRFLFVHTQKHTQKYLLDFKSSEIQHDCWLLAVWGSVSLSRTCLVPAATPTPCGFQQTDTHHTPTPQNSFGSHPAACTPCSARTTTKLLKTPPSLLKVPVIFLFLYFYSTLSGHSGVGIKKPP